MKIAILHDDLQVFGGGEKIALTLAKELNADLITFSLSEEVKKHVPSGVKIKTLYSGKKEDIENARRRFLFSKLDLKNKYDFFIFTSYLCLNASKKNFPNLFYAQSIPSERNMEKIKREYPETFVKINDSLSEKIMMKILFLRNQVFKRTFPTPFFEIFNFIRFFGSNNFNPFSIRFSFYRMSEGVKDWELKKVNKIISVSGFVKKRINSKYGINSKVIYPFVHLKKFYSSNYKNYWVSINRIHPQKRIELQIKAFEKLPNEKLFILGGVHDESYYDYLKKIASKNVNFLGDCNEEKVTKLLSNSKGLITTSKNEAFGLVVIEAMASGKPVIAPNEGGYVENIENEKTGVLIKDINSDKLVDAIKKMKNPKKYKKACLEQSKKFDIKVFIDEIKNEIKKGVNE